MASEFDFSSMDKSDFECLKFDDSSVYFGQVAWINDKGKICPKSEGKIKVRHGIGSQMFVAEDQSVLCKYEGQWKAGKKHGEGVISYPDGSVYAGCLENEMKEGFGKFVWPNGDEYNGSWVQDRMDGFGTFNHHEVK